MERFPGYTLETLAECTVEQVEAMLRYLRRKPCADVRMVTYNTL